MKIITARTRNMFGKLSDNYTAELTGTNWKATADSKDQATEDLRARLERQEHFIQARRYLVHAPSATTFVLLYADGWQYDIVKSDGQFSSCMLAAKSYMEALQIMTSHFNQWSNHFTNTIAA